MVNSITAVSYLDIHDTPFKRPRIELWLAFTRYGKSGALVSANVKHTLLLDIIPQLQKEGSEKRAAAERNSQAESSDFSSGSLPDTRTVVIFKMNQLQKWTFHRSYCTYANNICNGTMVRYLREKTFLYNSTEKCKLLAKAE